MGRSITGDPMGPYQVMTIIVACTLVFAAIVTLLTAQGLPLLVAFLVVYAVAIGTMFGMQRRARKSCDDRYR